MDGDEEVLGSDGGFYHLSIVFTNKRVLWNSSDGKYGGDWTYNQLRNGVTDSQVRSELRHLPNAQNAINAVLEIKNY